MGVAPTSANRSTSRRHVGESTAKSASGRKVGITRPSHPEAASARWCSSPSVAASVVASTSMPNVRKSARGRNSGDRSFSAISS